MSDVLASNLPKYSITDASKATVIEPDSTVEVDVAADSELNSHPVELGGFADYNRIQVPRTIRLLLACQGQKMTRASFLATLETLRTGTQIVSISTPDANYSNMTLKGYGYKKTAERGAVTIWADTEWKEEQSSNVTVSSPETAQPQGNAISNVGALSPLAPTTSQQACISNPLVPPFTLPLGYANTQPPSGAAF